MPKTSEESLINIRRAELGINNNLFLVCFIVTLVVMIMVIVEFFSRGNFLPTRIGFFYIGVLFIYSAHKEMLRWIEEKKGERQGEYFLYSWIVLTIILYVINFLTKDYFSYSLEGKPIGCLSEVSVITLEAGAIFLLARLSKVIKIMSERK